MKIKVERDGEHITNGEVTNLSDIPHLAFAVSQHHGGGEYLVRASEEGLNFEKDEPMFRLAAEWLEGEE